MPETNIGLFPDVGGGYFLSRCPGASGEYLALTGQMMLGADAITLGLADKLVDSAYIGTLWDDLAADPSLSVADRLSTLEERLEASTPVYHQPIWMDNGIDSCFAKATVPDIVQALSDLDSDWARDCLNTLRQRSPLMLHVVLEQIHRARHMTLANDLRMERNLVRHCFYTEHLGSLRGHRARPSRASALWLSTKTTAPSGIPVATIEDMYEPEMVAPFFTQPLDSDQQHPLADLG